MAVKSTCGLGSGSYNLFQADTYIYTCSILHINGGGGGQIHTYTRSILHINREGGRGGQIHTYTHMASFKNLKFPT